jgi:DNA-binding IclR family transcriptional regulator
MKNNDGVGINEIMEVTKKSNATVKRYLKLLKTINLIEFRGSAKTGKYYITEAATKKLKQIK